MNCFDLKGKKAVIFGIADERSVAWHVAKTLNSAGVQIAAAFQERSKSSVSPLKKKLKNSFFRECDVTDDLLLDNFFAEVKKKFGKIDFLIHSVAFAKKQFLQGKFFDVDKKGFMRSQEVSAYSLVELAKRAYPLMNKEGSVIAMTYLGSQRVVTNYNLMGVCKATLEACVRYLAKDMGDKKIRVNAISFGPVRTKAASGITDFEGHLKHYMKLSPLGRLNNQDDVANASLFLCSDLARNISGQVIFVDAGFNIMGL